MAPEPKHCSVDKCVACRQAIVESLIFCSKTMAPLHSPCFLGARGGSMLRCPTPVPRFPAATARGARRFAPRASIETKTVETATRQRETRAEDRLRPVVSTFDMSSDAHDALLWTVNHVCSDGDQVALVHVVCDPMMLHTATATGQTPGGWVVSASSMDDVAFESLSDAIRDYTDRLMDRARSMLEDSAAASEMQKKGVEHQVLVPLLNEPQSAASIGQALLRAAEEVNGRMLVLANHGPGSLVDFGSVVRYCYQHCPLPLLLIPQGVVDTALDRSGEPAPPPSATAFHEAARRGEARHVNQCQDVVLLVNSLEELQDHYLWVADNMCQTGDCIQVWHTGVETLDVPDIVQRGLDEHGVGLAFSGTVGSLVQSAEVAALGDKVCQMVDSPHIKAVAMVNSFRRQGLVREGLCGSLSSHLSRHCRKPLMLLQPTHVDTMLEQWSC